MNDKMKILELKNSPVKNTETADQGPHLFEEFGHSSEGISFISMVGCSVCKKAFGNKQDLGIHERKCIKKNYLNQKVEELEKQIVIIKEN